MKTRTKDVENSKESGPLNEALDLPPVAPPRNATTISSSDGGSVRSKLKKAPRSNGAAASPSVPAVPSIKESMTTGSTKGRSVLKKSALTGTTRLHCVVCKVHWASSEYSGIACSLTCIERFWQDGPTDPRMCNACHRRPKLQDQQQCGGTCADMAKAACLVCKFRPKDGKHDLCGLTCKRVAMKLAPFILEVPRDHTVYDMVERHFKRAWKGSHSSIPAITKVFKIIENEDLQRPYELYRVDVADPNGAFGQGIYTSSASSKAYDFCKADGALLLNKVVLGRVRQVNNWYEVTNCPQGYNSVVFEHKNGTRNETILYSDDAIRPVFLIMFQ
ncbi:hypothetical protein EST38_g7443 [Candolleomyces aberdarensis]|uniref:PARP catalytic domain-containing protein n=1 Tax=Candolleomyces aberdarensis TaxID=2316362 RepID=A0A4Q2DIE9_9AGAR|nr:hypothetical protein EST38_g7443 [Candolleomyces aberdarensis]